MWTRANFLFRLTQLIGRALRALGRLRSTMNDIAQGQSSSCAVESVPSAAVVVWAAPGELAPVAQPQPPNPAVVYLMGLAPGDSRRTQGSALRTIARFFASEFPALGSAEGLAWHELRYEHTQALRSWLAERRSPATANRHIAALRRVLRTAWRLGQMALEDYERAADVRSVKGVRVSKGRALDESELMGLLGTATDDLRRRRGSRDAAVVALAYGGGLRRAEIARLELGGYDGKAVTVVGKGNKERRVPLSGGARRAVEAWLERRGRRPGPLITSLKHGGRLRAEAVAQICKRLARRAQVAGFSPHDLRRSYISDLLDHGADLATVQQLAGHSSPATTARYDRRGERARTAAAELLTVFR
jgi:site-specific recombinase XerD